MKTISEDLAKDLLSACYALDVLMRDVEQTCLALPQSDATKQISTVVEEMTTILGAQLLVPIYEQHPQLGRVMEPDAWFVRGKSSGRILFREPD